MNRNDPVFLFFPLETSYFAKLCDDETYIFTSQEKIV